MHFQKRTASSCSKRKQNNGDKGIGLIKVHEGWIQRVFYLHLLYITQSFKLHRKKSSLSFLLSTNETKSATFSVLRLQSQVKEQQPSI